MLRTRRLLLDYRDPLGYLQHSFLAPPLSLVIKAIRYEVGRNPVYNNSIGRYFDALTSEMIKFPQPRPDMSPKDIQQRFYIALFYGDPSYGIYDPLEYIYIRCSERMSQVSDHTMDLLGAACLLGWSDTLEQLLQDKRDLWNNSGVFGSPYRAACTGNQVKCMEILWRHQGCRTIFWDDLYERLSWASQAGSTAVVEWLSTLPCDAVLDNPNRIRSRIMRPVCTFGHLQTLKVLGEKFFPQLIDRKNFWFCQHVHEALLYAVSGSHVDMIKYLVSNAEGHRCEWTEETALPCAIRARSLPSIKALLDLGTDPTEVDIPSQKRPLEVAYLCEDEKAIRLLADAIWRFKV